MREPCLGKASGLKTLEHLLLLLYLYMLAAVLGVGGFPLPVCSVFITWGHPTLLGIFICELSKRGYFPKLYVLNDNKNDSLYRVLMNENTGKCYIGRVC